MMACSYLFALVPSGFGRLVSFTFSTKYHPSSRLLTFTPVKIKPDDAEVVMAGCVRPEST